MNVNDLNNMVTPPTIMEDILSPLRSYNDSVLKQLPKIDPINPAKWAYESLIEYIKDFEAVLDDDHEIGARLVSFGQVITFHIEAVSYDSPSIITFYGSTETMEKVQLIQHVSQLSVLLITVKKQHDKPRRIGFTVEKEKAQSNP